MIMIIICISCNKKFDIDSNLIPEKGRLLQCNGCNHKWFFKKEVIKQTVASLKINESTNEHLNLLMKSLNIKKLKTLKI